MSLYRGGLVWGEGFLKRLFVSYPFAKLIIEEEFITFYAMRSEFRLARNEILGIIIQNRFLAKGLIFKHESKQLPPTIVFLTFHCEEVISQLKDIPLWK